MKKALISGVCALGLLTAAPAFANDGMPSREEMWQMIQIQQKQIKELQTLVKKQDQKIVATETKVEQNAAQVQETAIKVEETAKKADATEQTVASIDPASIEPAAGNGWWDRTSINGYGELHYNGGDVDQIDFHRFIIGVNHEFTDDIRLVSELEIEHTEIGDGKDGEVVLEQAFLEFDLTEDDKHRAKAGLFLLPVGILNEVHEPPTFFGVERNPVETNIIPTTFFEAGALLSGQLGNGFSYDVGAHSGLQTPVTGGNAYRIRNGRQKVSEAELTDPAFTGRLRWSGYPGVTVGASVQHQLDITQNSADMENVDATLVETHADIRQGGFGLRALYAHWDVNSDMAEAIGRDKQVGWYVEPSYRFEVPFGFDDGYGELGAFARYNEYDNNAGISNSMTDFSQTDIGFNYWPIPNVVLKADYNFIDGPTDAQDDSRLNLGVGYQF